MLSYFKKYKHCIMFFSILFCIGFFLGIVIALKNISFLEEHVNYYVVNIGNVQCNYFLYHFFIIVTILFLSFMGVGPFFSSIIHFYEGMSVGFTLILFSSVLGINGFIYACFFIIITKGVYLACLLIFNIKCFYISLDKIKRYFFKDNYSTGYKIRLYGVGVCFIIIFIYDLLLFGFASYMLRLFNFLIM